MQAAIGSPQTKHRRFTIIATNSSYPIMANKGTVNKGTTNTSQRESIAHPNQLAHIIPRVPGRGRRVTQDALW